MFASKTLQRIACVSIPAVSAGAFAYQVNADTTITTVTTTTSTVTKTETIADAPVDVNYPPHGIAPNVQKLEGWIQVGCGDKPYNCPEKGATFGTDGKCPDKMPDLSKHSSFMAECMTEEIYDKLKNRRLVVVSGQV